MILLSAIGNFEIQLINHAKLKTNQKRKKKRHRNIHSIRSSLLTKQKWLNKVQFNRKI